MRKSNRTKRQLKPSTSPLRVSSPLQNDVIVGLNGSFLSQHHHYYHGNQHLKTLIQFSRERYSKEKSSIGKEGIAITILQTLIELKPRGRILKRSQDGKSFTVQDESNSLEIIKELFQKALKSESPTTNVNGRPCNYTPPSTGSRRTALLQHSPDRSKSTNAAFSSRRKQDRHQITNNDITNADMSHVLDLLIKIPSTPGDKKT